jgi:hypothetical protein
VRWLGDRFSDLGGFVKGALNGAIDVLNNFADAVNGSPLGKIGLHIDHVSHFAQGGIVHGQGGGDTVPAMLTPGEVVLNTSAVRGLGGTAAANSLNKMGAAGIGEVGNQCVQWVEDVTGHFFPVAMASQMCAFVNTSSQAPGTIGVSALEPYGHTWINLPGGQVIDSNWVSPLIVGVHPLSSIPDVCGAIDLGTPLGALAGLGAAWNPSAIIDGIIGKLGLGGVAGWLRPATTGLLKKAGGAVVKTVEDKLGSVGNWVGHDVLHLDQGGVLPTGLSTVYNGLGGPEILYSGGRADQAHGRGGFGDGGGHSITQNFYGAQVSDDQVREMHRRADWFARTGSI